MWKGFRNKSAVDRRAYVVGPWTELVAVVDGVHYHIGTVKEGNLLVESRFHSHPQTSLPHRNSNIIKTATAVEFRGIMEEIHRQNVLLLQNRDPGEAVVDYIPTVDGVVYFQLFGRRPNAMGTDRAWVEFGLWKCRCGEGITLESEDEVVGTRFRAIAMNDQAGDHGGSKDSPYGFIRPAAQHVPAPAPSPSYTGATAWCWNFDIFNHIDAGRAVYMTIPVGNASLPDFSPANHGNDFTIAGFIQPNIDPRQNVYTQTIFGKRATSGTLKEWAVEKVSTTPNFVFEVQRVGANSVITVPDPWNEMRKMFFAARYTYVSDGASLMKLWIDANTYTNNAAIGPIPANNNYPIMIATSNPSSSAYSFFSKYYWLAYWDTAIPDALIEAVRDGSTHPRAAAPRMYCDFARYENNTAAMSYDTEEATGPNAPYSLVKTQISAGDDHEAWRQRGEENQEWWQFSSARTDYLRIPHASADDFNPATNGNDFSAAVLCDIGIPSTGQYYYIFGKWNTTSNNRVWTIAYLPYSTSQVVVNAWVSETGGAAVPDGDFSQAFYTGAAAVIGAPVYQRAQHFIGMTYHYVSHGSSVLKLYYRKRIVTNSTAVGPPHNATDADLYIARRHGSTPQYANLMMYKCAYWDTCLSDSEMEDVRSGAETMASSGAMMGIDFDGAVGANYVSEVGGYTFSVGGAPVLYDWTSGI